MNRNILAVKKSSHYFCGKMRQIFKAQIMRFYLYKITVQQGNSERRAKKKPALRLAPDSM